MAAPSNAYRTNKLIVTGTSIPVVYNNIAIPDALPNILRQRFYCDLLLPVDTPEGSGFIGMVESGNTWEKFHNPNRKTALRAKIGNRTYYSVDDAGLNTLPIHGVIDVVSAKVGDVQISTAYSSAYYLTSTSAGLKFSINGSPEIEYVIDSNIPANHTIYYTDLIPPTGENITSYPAHKVEYPFSIDDHVTIRGYITNDEGTMYSGQPIEFWVTNSVYYFRITRYFEDTYTRVVINLLDANEEAVGITENINFTFNVQVVQNGHTYIYQRIITLEAYENQVNDDIYFDEYFGGEDVTSVTPVFASYSPHVTQDGVDIIDINNIPPTYPPSETIVFTGYDTQYGYVSCSVNNPKTVYRDENNVHWKNPELTIWADDGFYSRDGFWIALWQGSIEDTDSC